MQEEIGVIDVILVLLSGGALFIFFNYEQVPFEVTAVGVIFSSIVVGYLAAKVLLMRMEE